ncbi:MAG: hypothetical protein A2808_00460 [Candidatus Moranbacteria bacterium RIFCSPHIGHO2_01_FULL_55_24]|nr:MAG: hypothetical protein A2808_00460 [Candidatus Moranbacteria bacterium RIFCSPHIGHO2_01_FULL_55_24]
MWQETEVLCLFGLAYWETNKWDLKHFLDLFRWEEIEYQLAYTICTRKEEFEEKLCGFRRKKIPFWILTDNHYQGDTPEETPHAYDPTYVPMILKKLEIRIDEKRTESVQADREREICVYKVSIPVDQSLMQRFLQERLLSRK